MMTAKEIMSVLSAVMGRKTKKAAMERLDMVKSEMYECDYNLIADTIKETKVKDLYNALDELFIQYRTWAAIEKA